MVRLDCIIRVVYNPSAENGGKVNIVQFYRPEPIYRIINIPAVRTYVFVNTYTLHVIDVRAAPSFTY